MRRLLLPLLVLAAACSPDVVVDGESGGTGVGGAGGATATATSTGTASGCDGKSFSCAAGCGADYFPEEAQCVDGAWVCPPGTVNPDDCPPGTCWGLPLDCEVCDGGWACEPTPACAGGCPGLVCAVCPEEPVVIEGCDCACDDSGMFSCVKADADLCCDHVEDCGDGYISCVNSVCKELVPNGCWTDKECGGGALCDGAFICPCAADCAEPDHPGTCVGGPD